MKYSKMIVGSIIKAINISVRITFCLVYLLPSAFILGTTYYIDATGGDDSEDGTSLIAAWQTLDMVNGTSFLPGDSILFKSGEVWTGQLHPAGNGDSTNPIVISKFGGDMLPIISGGGITDKTVYLFNQSYWSIQNLEITNYDANSVYTKYGVYIQGQDIGAIYQIILKDLIVHDVNSDLSNRYSGGIYLDITGNATPTWFDGVLIEGCHVYDVDPSGIANQSSWRHRTSTDNSSWYPSYNLVVSNNFIERTGRNGCVIRVADHPISEHNIFKECAIKGEGNSNYPYNCDNALIQFNEAYLTHYNSGEVDAGGFDSDYFCHNTIIQYNYSHDNDYGALLVCSNGAWSPAFNDSTIVRYNIFQNDDHHVIRFSGNPTNTVIHNNTIYIGSHLSGIDIIWFKNWGGYTDGTSFYNNIFYNLCSNSNYNYGASSNNLFSNNLFYGTHPSSEPFDYYKVIDDPQLFNPGNGGTGLDSLEGYFLQVNSPAINSGLLLPGHAELDFWGDPVPYDNSKPDIGADEFQGVPVINPPDSDTLFSDLEYFGNSNNWAPFLPDRWEVVDDELDPRFYLNSSSYTAPDPNRLGEYAILRDRIYDDFNISFIVKTAEDLTSNDYADYAFIFGFSDQDNYWQMQFNANPSSTKLVRVFPGNTHLLLASLDYAIVTDTVYHEITVQKVGSTLSVQFDGEILLELSNNFLDITGAVGVGSRNDAVYFDEFSVNEIVGIKNPDPRNIPMEFKCTVFPNPFNSIVTFSFDLPTDGNIILTIFDIVGKKVLERKLSSLNQGSNQFIWDGIDDVGSVLPSGLYLYTVRYQEEFYQGRIILLK